MEKKGMIPNQSEECSNGKKIYYEKKLAKKNGKRIGRSTRRKFAKKRRR